MLKNPLINQQVKSYSIRMQARKNLSYVAMKIAQLIQMNSTFKYRNEQSQPVKDSVFIDLINKTLKCHTAANEIHLVQVNQILVYRTKQSLIIFRQ